MDCQEFEELSGAYVLDAVTPEERELAEEHIAQCPHCAQIVHELQLAVNALPLSVPIVEPSIALKERILESIKSEPPPVTHTASPVQLAGPGRRRKRNWQRWSTQLLVAATLIMFLLLGGMTAWNISLQQQVNSLSANTSTMSYVVRGESVAPNVTGSLTCLRQQQLCLLAVRDLPLLQGTQVYQGWLLKGKDPVSIGLLNLRNGVASVGFQGNIENYDAAAISVEPGPVASKDAPRGQIVAVGEVSKPTEGHRA